MSRWLRVLLLVGIAIVAANGWFARAPDSGAALKTEEVSSSSAATTAGDSYRRLPPEAHATIAAIERGGPFAYDRDGAVFQNRERRLPAQPRGYYREFTVLTPGSRDRGARRIVSGGQPPEVYYYTDDHYRTFRRVEVPR